MDEKVITLLAAKRKELGVPDCSCGRLRNALLAVVFISVALVTMFGIIGINALGIAQCTDSGVYLRTACSNSLILLTAVIVFFIVVVLAAISTLVGVEKARRQAEDKILEADLAIYKEAMMAIVKSEKKKVA